MWYYTFGVNCKHKFSRSHAHLFHMVKDPSTSRSTSMRFASPRPGNWSTATAGRTPPAGCPTTRGSSGRKTCRSGFQPDEDTWYFPRVCGTFKERAGWHGCQMPEQLLGRIIRACSHEGELVLDPFAGSGTTLAVAKKLGRRFLGFELSKEYSERIQQRLAQVRPGDPLDGAAEPLVSVPNTANGRRLEDRHEGKKREGRRKRKSESKQMKLDL